MQTLGYVTLVVRDYDEALEFFTAKLGFQVIDDKPAKDRLGREKRWVLVAPPRFSWHEPASRESVNR